MSRNYRYVPPNAVPKVRNTTVSEESIVIDFCFYKDNRCELDQMTKASLIRKIMKFIKKIGQCMDGDELIELLKANNSCDITESRYSGWAPSNMKLYEVWHMHNCGERIFFSYTGNVFYPVVFLLRHEF